MPSPVGGVSGPRLPPDISRVEKTQPVGGDAIKMVADTAHRLVEAQNKLALVFREANEAHYLGHKGREEKLNGQLEDVYNVTQQLAEKLDAQLAGLKADQVVQLHSNTELSSTLSEMGFDLE